MYPKARIEALTDGLFGVAMTILVLDVRLPDDFNPADQGALARALLALWPKFFPYALSFYVLGSTWLANIKVRARGEFVDRRCPMSRTTSTCLIGKFRCSSFSVRPCCAQP